MSRVQLVSAEAAHRLLQSTKVVPVDATWYMPNSPMNARDQFAQERLPGAVFYDLDKIACPTSKYPHMLPPQRIYEEELGKLGISNSSPVLVYDKAGIFSSPRVAWTFALFGHQQVHLLDHYPLYKKQFGVESGVPRTRSASTYTVEGFATQYHQQVIEHEQLLSLVETGEIAKYHLFDARAHDRFTGKAPEPRPGLPSGHVPGALSLPFGKVLDSEGHFKLPEEIDSLFKSEFGIDLRNLRKDIIVMCGTGVTAVILRIAIESVAKVPIRVYDGSWTEWAQRSPDVIEVSK